MEPELTLVAPTQDLGDGFAVRRALPSARRRMVGPFIFFDPMGPVVLGTGRGLDVRPVLEDGGARVRVVLGEADGKRSPVKLHSELFYASAELEAGARVPLPRLPRERAVYVAPPRQRGSSCSVASLQRRCATREQSVRAAREVRSRHGA